MVEVEQRSDNQIEILVAHVQNMRLCQRESRNKDFYAYREKAMPCSAVLVRKPTICLRANVSVPFMPIPS